MGRRLRQREIQILHRLVDFGRILETNRHAIDARIIEREAHRRLPVLTGGEGAFPDQFHADHAHSLRVDLLDMRDHLADVAGTVGVEILRVHFGAVDLWPIVGDLPERKKLLYVSPPWARMTYALVFPRTMRVSRPSDIAGKTLAAIVRISSDARVVHAYFRGAAVVPQPGLAELLAAVCSGEAQAGLVSLNAFVDSRSPACRIGPLRIQPVEGATYWFGVGANRDRPDAVAAADILRDEVGAMAADGRLAAIDFSWNTKIGLEVNTIFAYRQARIYARVFLSALAVLFPTLVGMVWLAPGVRGGEGGGGG